jgi:hypothetical protein
MNPITLKISFADGSTVDAVAGAADFIAFESKFDKSVQSFTTDVRLTYLFFLAWHSLKRVGQTKKDFDQWVEDVAGIEGVDDPKA